MPVAMWKISMRELRASSATTSKLWFVRQVAYLVGSLTLSLFC